MYNQPRRGTYNYGNAASNVGQRRNQNQQQGKFIPGGQLQQNTGPVFQPPLNQQNRATPQAAMKKELAKQQTPQSNLQKSVEALINQQNAQESKNVAAKPAPQPVPVPQQQVKPTPQQQAKPTPQQQAKPTLQKPATPAQQQQAPPPPAIQAQELEIKPDLEESMDATVETKVKPAWMKKGKIGRAEKIRRRNRRLKKILQPKNALMVLNEIVGSTAYELSEVPANMFSPGMMISPNFKATVSVDGKIHEGYGKNKPSAKTAAAEAALKHLVITKMSTGLNEESAMDTSETEGGEEKMVEDEKEEDVSFCHLASFALFKLFNSWSDGGKILSRSNSNTSLVSETKCPVKEAHEMKPSKKLPDNPEQMNPVMLLNQMFPGAVYEEVCKTGVPPKIVFTMKCTIDGRSFIGNGPNKKISRRVAAYQACKEVLGIEYPDNMDQ